jgi:DNA-binding LacI/PurR family transcriptional regulator
MKSFKFILSTIFVSCLFSVGCKDIVHLSGPQNLQIGKNRKDGYIIGGEAVKLLINRLEKKYDLPYQTIVIKTEMVIKGSSKNV